VTAQPLAGLRRLRTRTEPARKPMPQAGERCEMCGEVVADEHSHVAKLDDRRLLCVCRACYLLFTREGAAGGRYRAVPDRYARMPGFVLRSEQWERLQIPVDLAFFFQQSDLGSFVACYPSPGGATESLLDLDTWTEVIAANPALAQLAPDVEAVLVRRNGTDFECFQTPIDACYELVGIVRTHWLGFHGGEEVWRRIDEFFDDLRRRSGKAGG
jgi:hypothetical protein